MSVQQILRPSRINKALEGERESNSSLFDGAGFKSLPCNPGLCPPGTCVSAIGDMPLEWTAVFEPQPIIAYYTKISTG